MALDVDLQLAKRLRNRSILSSAVPVGQVSTLQDMRRLIGLASISTDGRRASIAKSRAGTFFRPENPRPVTTPFCDNGSRTSFPPAGRCITPERKLRRQFLWLDEFRSCETFLSLTFRLSGWVGKRLPRRPATSRRAAHEKQKDCRPQSLGRKHRPLQEWNLAFLHCRRVAHRQRSAAADGPRRTPSRLLARRGSSHAPLDSQRPDDPGAQPAALPRAAVRDGGVGPTAGLSHVPIHRQPRGEHETGSRHPRQP